MSTFRVVSLQAQNIMRLYAVDIQWDAGLPVLTIGGRNGAGKSSALNAVAMALGGMALCPEEPIRRGETEASVKLDLGDLVVTRRFWREATTCECGHALIGHSPESQQCQAPDCTCQQKRTVYDTKSSLIVRNAEGIEQRPAQTLLDRLISKTSFDPMAFVHEEPKRQEDILRQIVKLDVSALEEKRKVAFERRAHFNKAAKEKHALMQSLSHFPDAPAAEISMTEVTAEMQKAEQLRSAAKEAERNWMAQQASVAKARSIYQECDAQIVQLREQAAALQAKADQRALNLLEYAATITEAELAFAAAQDEVERAVKAIPDVSAIQNRLVEVEATNQKVRANAAHAKVTAEHADLTEKAKASDEMVTEMVEAKRKALAAVAFPVDGLSLTEDGVTFNGIPFKQASTAEQIRTSVAIGFALNPGLKLLLVKNGNALDEDSMKLVAAEAAKAGGQILMEYVTKDASQVSVMIEDGHRV